MKLPSEQNNNKFDDFNFKLDEKFQSRITPKLKNTSAAVAPTAPTTPTTSKNSLRKFHHKVLQMDSNYEPQTLIGKLDEKEKPKTSGCTKSHRENVNK